MKKLLIILVMLFFSITMIGQKMSNYEKYKLEQEKGVTVTQNPDTLKEAKIEYDDLYYQPSKDSKVKKQRKPYKSETDQLIDTLKKYNPNVTVNYYELDPFYYSSMIGRYHHFGFNYWMYADPWYYNSYWMYDNYDWYWEMRFMPNYYWRNSFYFGYTTFGNYWRPWPDYSWNYYGYRHYGYNNWNHNQWNNHSRMGMGIAQNTPQYGRRDRPSTMSTPKQENQPTRRVTSSPQNMKSYSESRRTYTPAYESPRMSTRPAYNNSKPNSGMMEQRRANMSNGNMRTNTSTAQPRGNMDNMRNSTQNKTYTTPARNYVQPQQQSQSRREFAPTQSRSNFNSSPSRSYSAPPQNNSGSSNSSSGSRSSSSSSSGGSTSSGRR